MNKKYTKKLKKQFLKEALTSSEYLINHMANSYRVDDDYLNTLDEWEKLMNCAFENIEKMERLGE